jgi:predicted nicotinamide N-methyase
MTAGSQPPHFDIGAFIRERLPLSAVSSIPEVLLHQADAASGLSHLPASGTPYWAYVWAGGAALARHVLDHPWIVAGKRVLDLGTGSGLVAIAAALAGAREVVATDVDPYALAALSLNAAANGVAITGTLGDLTGSDPISAELILAGDVFYDADLARRVTAFLDRAAASGVQVLVGDPGRAPLPLARLEPLARYTVPDFGGGRGAMTPSTVFSFPPGG